MFPSRETAEALLEEALPHNPGPWGDHSRTAAHCAECIAKASHGVLGIEERMLDVKRRYGAYPQHKWDINVALKAHFEQLCGGRSIYEVVEKETYRP